MSNDTHTTWTTDIRWFDQLVRETTDPEELLGRCLDLIHEVEDWQEIHLGCLTLFTEAVQMRVLMLGPEPDQELLREAVALCVIEQLHDLAVALFREPVDRHRAARHLLTATGGAMLFLASRSNGSQ